MQDRLNIIVVDDRLGIRSTLAGILEDEGQAEDGYKGIAAAENTHFDIMFIEVLIPGIDGFQTLEEIKKIDPVTNVIMMTDQDIEEQTRPYHGESLRI